ncbi:MAG: HAMP domain-containing sensor histidine kinase [Pseudomonadota bacterium]
MAIKNIQTAHLVHDLKNPVNIIESGARSLLEKQARYGALTASQEKVIRRILRSALRIKCLANSMLEVDMAAAGILNIGKCTLAAILKTALVEIFDLVDPQVAESLVQTTDLAELKDVLQHGGVHLDVEEDIFQKTIYADEVKMSLILTNLLSNAFKYKQKNVFLRCSTDPETITISVKDDGPGIPEAYHAQVFQQYFQCIPVEGFPVRGHGLGLAGAQSLAEAMGGGLFLCNSNQGAEFTVRVKTIPPK